MPWMAPLPPLGGEDLSQSRMLSLMKQKAQQDLLAFGYAPPERQPFEPFGPSPLDGCHSHAPMLTRRDIQLPVAPCAFPDAYVQPVEPKPSSAAIAEAFAAWYTDQVIYNLVVPGSFRPGVGGSSDDVWGRAGRDRREREEMGLKCPDYPQPWGRMGMTPSPRAPRVRRPSTEKHDPWSVGRRNMHGRSTALFNFVHDVITRMSITPVAIVSAVWYLQGLGLHECDDKGAELRAQLRRASLHETEGVEKRVAVLGLLLAGKWLDDNSFLTKSWTEVTSIPVKEVDLLERICLRDYHHSLFIPVPAWVDHVNKLFATLDEAGGRLDKHYSIVLSQLDDMSAEARTSESLDPLHPAPEVVDLERRFSIEQLPAAGEQATSRDWTNYARSFAYDFTDAEAERNVAMLVDDDMEDFADARNKGFFDDEDEEEFLDYDGARPFLRRTPRTPHLQRSSSHSSERSVESQLSLHGEPTQYPNFSTFSVETQPNLPCYKTQYSSPLGDLLEPVVGSYVEPGVQIVAPPPKYEYGAKCWSGANPLSDWY